MDVVTSFKATKNPVRTFAGNENLQLIDFVNFNKEQVTGYDLGLVVSFGHLIPERLIKSFPLGILNVHASLLPKLRGAAPIIHAIRNGDRRTGVTIMKIRPKHFDVGAILLQEEIEIGSEELMPVVHDRLGRLGADLLLECVLTLPQRLNNLMEQREEEATYAPKIDEEFCRVRWDKMTAKEVFDLYRALYSFKFPTTSWGKEIVKLKEVRLSSDESLNKMPGTARWSHKNRAISVTCADGNEVDVVSFGIGKKSKISAQDFNNGFLKKVQEIDRRFS